MPVVTMPLKPSNAQAQLSATLSATLRELCRYLAASPTIQLSELECVALAVAALNGHAEAEFLVGSIFDAAGNPARAMEWYRRSASRDYLPAVLQLFAVR
jgi:TPR repeat protein